MSFSTNGQGCRRNLGQSDGEIRRWPRPAWASFLGEGGPGLRQTGTLIKPEDSGVCILARGDIGAVNIRESWFGRFDVDEQMLDYYEPVPVANLIRLADDRESGDVVAGCGTFADWSGG
jgi:hypothetical protein